MNRQKFQIVQQKKCSHEMWVNRTRKKGKKCSINEEKSSNSPIILYKSAEYISLLLFSLASKSSIYGYKQITQKHIYNLLYTVCSHIPLYKCCKMFSRSHSREKNRENTKNVFHTRAGLNVFLLCEAMLHHLGWKSTLVEQCTHFQLCFIVGLYVFLSRMYTLPW